MQRTTIKYLLLFIVVFAHVTTAETAVDQSTTDTPDNVNLQKKIAKPLNSNNNNNGTRNNFINNSNLMTEFITTADDRSGIFFSIDDNFIDGMCMFLNISTHNCNCKYLESHHVNLTGICKETEKLTICEIDNSMKANTLFSIIASFIGIIGNSLVIMVRSKSTLKSAHYQLIMGLATADLIFSIAQAMYYIPYLIVGCKWIYGRSMCSILPSLLGVSSAVDVGFIVIIAAERYNAIVHPLKKSISPKKVYALTILNVIVAVCSAIPMLIVFDLTSFGSCSENWSNYPNGSIAYSWVLMIFFLVLPVAVTTVLYCRCLKAVKSTLHRSEVATDLAGTKLLPTKLITENKRVLVVISSLLIAFVLLNSPNRIVWLIIDHAGYQNLSRELYNGLKIFGVVPYSLHIMINPIIYSVVDKTFRRNVMSLLKRRKQDGTRDSSQTINLIFESSKV